MLHTYKSESCYTYAGSQYPNHTYEWVMSHFWKWVMSHMQVASIQIIQMKESCHSTEHLSRQTTENDSCHTYALHTNESCHTTENDSCHTYALHTNESCHTTENDSCHTYALHTNESCHTTENESCHTYALHTNESCHTTENGSCHNTQVASLQAEALERTQGPYRWVTSHIWIRVTSHMWILGMPHTLRCLSVRSTRGPSRRVTSTHMNTSHVAYVNIRHATHTEVLERTQYARSL